MVIFINLQMGSMPTNAFRPMFMVHDLVLLYFRPQSPMQATILSHLFE